MSLTPEGILINIRKEASFRTVGTTTWYAFDWTKQFREEFEIPEPERQAEDYWTVGGGRDVAGVLESGYNAAEMSVTFDILTGMFFYYAMGSCSTTGTEAPYTHTITAANSLPSFELLITQPGTTTLNTHLKGCLVKAIEISQEVGDTTPVQATVDILVCESATTATTIGSTASTTSSPLELRRFHFPDIGTCYMTYLVGTETATLGGASGFKSIANKVSFKIENEIDTKNIFGDSYPNRVIVKKRMITVNTDIEIQDYTYRNLTRLKVPTYASQYNTTGFMTSAIPFKNVVSRTATDYIQADISHLRIDPTFKNKLPHWDAGVNESEIPWMGAPGVTTTITVQDALSAEYYEVS